MWRLFFTERVALPAIMRCVRRRAELLCVGLARHVFLSVAAPCVPLLPFSLFPRDSHLSKKVEAISFRCRRASERRGQLAD